VHQRLDRKANSLQRSQQFIEKAAALRQHHPEMGCRKIALLLKQPGFGRDKTEAMLMGSGFRVKYPPNYARTTHSVRFSQFKNRIEGLVIAGINKVVQTDITYLWVRDRFYYLVFIIDVYSRYIVGYHGGCSLEAEANIKALQMMIALRGKQNLKGLIHHSDKGSQYHCKKYLAMLKDNGIKISMCNQGWQNAYSERINRTIKDEYLRHRHIDSVATLQKEMKQAIKLYNQQRPHWKLLQQMTPAGFEQYVNGLAKAKRPKLLIYKPEE
jgi:putative transposase